MSHPLTPEPPGAPLLRKAAQLQRVEDIVEEWKTAPAWPGPDHLKYMTRIAKVFE